MLLRLIPNLISYGPRAFSNLLRVPFRAYFRLYEPPVKDAAIRAIIKMEASNSVRQHAAPPKIKLNKNKQQTTF